MRLGSINGLRLKQLKLVILAFFMLFLLWKWEKGTYYDSEILQPDPLVLTHPGHLKHTETLPLLSFFLLHLPPFSFSFKLLQLTRSLQISIHPQKKTFQVQIHCLSQQVKQKGKLLVHHHRCLRQAILLMFPMEMKCHLLRRKVY